VDEESNVSSTNEPSDLSDPERHLPPHHNPLPEITDFDLPKPIAQAEFEHVQSSDEFVQLRRKFRNFAFPMTLVFVFWYFLYVLLSTYAVGFMSIPLIGYVNVGLAMGLAQFATTFGITWLYVRHANRHLDPLAAQLRDDLEGGTHHANG